MHRPKTAGDLPNRWQQRTEDFIMWGENLRYWFELFAGIAVFKVTANGPDNNDGWINISNYENRFCSDRITFNGRPYDPKDTKHRNELLDAIINNAGILCAVKLLERRRQIDPPSLDYRVTKIGRRIDAWGYGENAGFRKKALFFLIETYLRLQKHWKIITIGAAGWAIVNACKFYTTAFDYIRTDFFLSFTAVAVAFVIWLAQAWDTARN